MSGKQVRLYLVDGKPGGLMTAEVGNWTGHVLRGKRLELGEIRKRAEAGRTGIRILFGSNAEGTMSPTSVRAAPWARGWSVTT